MKHGSERASQREQNGRNFSSVAPSSEELRACKDKTAYYSPHVLAKILSNGIWQTRIPSERASQEEQNGTNFSLIAPSSEEL